MDLRFHRTGTRLVGLLAGTLIVLVVGAIAVTDVETVVESMGMAGVVAINLAGFLGIIVVLLLVGVGCALLIAKLFSIRS